jgi:tRNA threonylcarbamoyladenosine biosynthesis protein TsaE
VSRQFLTDSDDSTIALGRRLAAEVRAPLLILLHGDMGAGKTTFSKGLISGLGVAREEDVASPTFTLVHQYGPQPLVYHVDLYRIEPGRDLDTLGLDDLWDDHWNRGEGQKAVILIEWAEKAAGLFNDRSGPRWEFHFEDLGGDRRRINLKEFGIAESES